MEIEMPTPDQKILQRVYVVYGYNHAVRDAMYAFLESLDLPLESSMQPSSTLKPLSFFLQEMIEYVYIVSCVSPAKMLRKTLSSFNLDKTKFLRLVTPLVIPQNEPSLYRSVKCNSLVILTDAIYLTSQEKRMNEKT